MKVRVHHPLQQGLRPVFSVVFITPECVRVHHPLQQGLRPLKERRCMILTEDVRVHHPLQQGLRRACAFPTLR